MLQRVLVGTSVLAAAACLAAVGFMWSAVQQSNAATAALREELQRGLTDLTTAVRDQQASTSPPRAPGANETVLTSLELVDLNGNSSGLLDELRVTVTVSKPGGIVDSNPRAPQGGIVPLGHLVPGEYSAKITSPWSETGTMQFVVQPSLTPFHVKIPCPIKKQEPIQTTFQFNWPESFKKHNIGVVVDCESEDQLLELPQSSDTSGLAATVRWRVPRRMFLIRPNGDCHEYMRQGFQLRSSEAERRFELKFFGTPRIFRNGELPFVEREFDLQVRVKAVVWPTAISQNGWIPAFVPPGNSKSHQSVSLKSDGSVESIAIQIPQELIELVERRIEQGSLNSEL